MTDPKEYVLHNGAGWEITERSGGESPLRYRLWHDDACLRQAETLDGLKEQIRILAEYHEAEADEFREILSKI